MHLLSFESDINESIIDSTNSKSVTKGLFLIESLMFRLGFETRATRVPRLFLHSSEYLFKLLEINESRGSKHVLSIEFSNIEALPSIHRQGRDIFDMQ